MPDKRLFGEELYSTHPGTRRVRNRLARYSPEQLAMVHCVVNETRALKNAMAGRARYADYQRLTSVAEKKRMLELAVDVCLSKRYADPSTMHLYTPRY